MKKILSVILAVVMTLCICPLMTFAMENTSGVIDSGYCGADGDNLTWTLYKDGELVISGEGEMLNFGFNDSPWHETYRQSVKTVIVENGVTSIGDNAFRGFYYATTFRIADSVISIGEYSFGWASFGFSANNGLREVKIPETVTDISNNAFYGSDIDRVIIPENITTIKERTFFNCNKLDTVVIPAGVTRIEDDAFAGCSEIHTVYFRGTEEQWNNITFGTGNGYLNSAENIVFDAVCHDYETNVVVPTCKEKGYTSYVCKICGDEYIDETSYTDKTAHQVTNGQCSVCKMFIVGEYEEISLSINLTTDSKVTWSLSDNNAEIVSTGSSTVSWGSYVNVIASATIKGISAGTTILTATVNGNVVSTAEIEIIKHEHFYDSFVTAPTCTEKGYTTYTCFCGLSYVDDYVNAEGHDYTTVVTAPTCTEKGYTTYTCFCGLSYIDDYVNAEGHDYTTVVTAPTCTENGYTTYTCFCGFSDRLDYVLAPGHTPGEWNVVTEAQVGVEGKEQQRCTVCSVVIDERIIPALPEETISSGDINGDGKVTAADARIVLRISAKLDSVENYNLPPEAFDVTGDEKLTAADARKILRIAARLEP